MPRKFRDDEDQPWWRRKRFEPVPEPVIKTRHYKVTIGNLEHVLTITKRDDLYTLTIEFSKPMTDSKGVTRNSFGMQAKDLQFLKSSARNFLASFGLYHIEPL